MRGRVARTATHGAQNVSHVTCSLGGYERNFYEEPAEFRAAASEYLKEHLRETSVLATQANKPKLEDQPYWFATITDGDDIVGVAMRTKPTPPHPAYVQKLRPAALAALQDALSERGEKLPGCIGHFETAKALAGPGARLEMHSRLHFFDEVVWPACPAGELRAATPDDVDLIVDWRRQFVHDSEEQAGRKPCEKRYAAFFNAADMAERLARGGHWLWEVDGQPVHYTAVNDTGLGLKRIGPVFTPADKATRRGSWQRSRRTSSTTARSRRSIRTEQIPSRTACMNGLATSPWATRASFTPRVVARRASACGACGGARRRQAPSG